MLSICYMPAALRIRRIQVNIKYNLAGPAIVAHSRISIITRSPYFEKDVLASIPLFDMMAYNTLKIFIFLSSISLNLKYSSGKFSSLSAI